MGESGALTLLVGVVVVAIVLQCAAAQTAHVVGGDVGWKIPPNASVYTDWASSTRFHVNDTLTFNFDTGAHDVVEVPQASYNSCSPANAIATITNGPASVNLTSIGEHYYICTIGQHCAMGQKLEINVLASASPTPPSGSSPPTTTPPATTTTPSPPPPPGSSSSAVFASFFVTLLPIAMGFFL